MISWTDSYKVADEVFGITQKPLYITYQTWSGNISQIKKIFWTCFVTWRTTDH